MEKIKNNLSNRNNIMSNDNDIYEECKKEQVFSRLNSRKKKIQLLIMQKRYSGDYINLNANTNKNPTSSLNKYQNKKIDIDSLAINEEYKSEMFPWRSNKYQKALMLNAICRVIK